ncbi:MAG: phosphoribosylanthranilate isomerase [Chryseolinea sp.]
MDSGIKVKICGMKERDNILTVAALRPHYLGFIEYPLSPRYVGDEFVMPVELSQSTTRVGVFVNESSEVIFRKAAIQGYEYVQLHGDETAAQCRELKDGGLKIIKVFSVDDHFNFAVTKSFVSDADYFLFDTKGKLYGGNGKAFDWNMLKHYDQEVPFFLSGGLSVDNLADLTDLAHMNICAIDLNSGVEVSPGIKDITKVAKVMDRFPAL